MRRRRFRPRTQQGTLKKAIVFGLIFCILLPVGAIYIGLKVTENWIVPVFDSSELLGDSTQEIDLSKTDEPVEENKEENSTVDSNLTEVVEIKSISIYAIQIASITDRSNIDNLISELNEKGLPHLIYSVDGKLKVFTHGSTQRTFIEEKTDEVKEHYPDAFISEMFLPKKVVKYDEKDSIVADVIGDINNIIELIDKQSEEWYNYGATKNYKDLLSEHEELLDKLNEKMSDDEFSESYFNKTVMEKALIYQQNNISNSLEILENEEDDHRIHSLFLDSLFRVVELTK